MRTTVKIDRSAATHYPVVAYMLRREDINAMIADGSIKNQHFLIEALAAAMVSAALNENEEKTA